MYRPSSPTTLSAITRRKLRSNDLITSENHPGWRKATWKEDRGGPFEVVKREYLSPIFLPYDWGDWYGPTQGGFKTVEGDNLNNQFPDAKSIGDQELRGLGAAAINIVAPTMPRTQLLTFLGELREGLPNLTGTAISHDGLGATSVASEYLNYQFGVLPTVSDVTSLADVWGNSQTLWDNYAANSGKLRRRRLVFPPTIESWTTQSVEPVVPHPLVGVHWCDTLTLDVVRRQTWFSGSFIYYVPTNPFQREASRLHYLFGVGYQDVPATAWELVPYSWLVDWVSNTGTVLENLSAFATDGLVMPYGYICETTVHSKYKRMVRTTGDRAEFNFGFRTTRKKRIKASPYGFDVDWPNLSTRQLGILAALGITRARR